MAALTPTEIEALVAEARANHVRANAPDHKGTWCPECASNWPCDAIRLADALEAAGKRERRICSVETLCLDCAEKMRSAVYAARASTQEKR